MVAVSTGPLRPPSATGVSCAIHRRKPP
jgi:hypothetical protein